MSNATPIVFVVDDDVSVRESLEGLNGARVIWAVGPNSHVVHFGE